MPSQFSEPAPVLCQSTVTGANPRPDQRKMRVLAMFPFYNEATKLQRMAGRLRSGLVDEFLAVDNASTDGGAQFLASRGIKVISQPRRGVGNCIRTAIEYGRANDFDVLVVMAGNDKDDPEEIPLLLNPIQEGLADYVQGSRFMAGGSSPNLPLFRFLAIKLLSVLFKFYSRTPCTDLTNGFRAYRLSLFDDPRFNLDQRWIDTYEFEYYVHWNVFQSRYKMVEVPVTKTYPDASGVAYTKIRPFVGWWKMLRPFLFLALGIKK
jgi:dolichol-phosphate mannosyltransferase